ncbi:uncharacterized protein LOC132744058 [Ruditapes philippinarum]|uniref:uncharacterized protein LOC132744058 n=1 Tax=Ruditapes philippinarum TaxID=129788 RepID=UPI00295AF88B|nr:uncharacterized protein LOC132744058 [Ruditapes philippinarum]
MPRVIIVSDFDATIDTQFKGRDADNSEDRIKVQRELFKLGLTYKSRDYGVFCVPIGESNRPVTEGFISKCGGEIVPHKGAKNVGNYYRYQVTIGRAFVDYDEGLKNNQDLDVYSLVQSTMPQTGLDKKHEKAVVALLEKVLQKEDGIDDSDEEEIVSPTENKDNGGGKVKSNCFDDDGDDDDDDEEEEDDDDPPDLPEWVPTRNVDTIGFEEQGGLPSIGSRVVRGKDWKWGDQDANGPGTVVGHKQKGIAYILWDNDQIGAYRHNLSGQYDVIKSQEPRHVTPGNIEVGCCVIRGTDWNRGDEDGGSGTVGVVVRKLTDRYVMVRWPSRVIETYKFGADNKWDLEVTQDVPHAAGNDQVEEPVARPPSVPPQGQHSEETLKPWWSWMDSRDQWRPFSEQSVAKLEHKMASGLPQQQCLVDYENKPVKVFLSQNICEIGGVQHHVKREMLKADEIESMKMLEQYLEPIN